MYTTCFSNGEFQIEITNHCPQYETSFEVISCTNHCCIVSTKSECIIPMEDELEINCHITVTGFFVKNGCDCCSFVNSDTTGHKSNRKNVF